jgi:hypothetical protein
MDFGLLPVEEYVHRRDAGEVLDPASLVFPRLERIVFNTPAEFAALAERYLRDDDAREAVLAELRAVVLRDHTYAAVLGRVLDDLRGALRANAQRSAPPP